MKTFVAVAELVSAEQYLRSSFEHDAEFVEGVSGDFGPRICLEGCIREPQRAQQYRTIGQMASNGGVLLVHRVVAGDESHNSAGAYNIKTLRQEVVVSRAREVRTSAIRRIEHWVVSEWNIANHGIEEVSRKLRLFEGLRMDIRIRVELTGDSSRHGIKLNTGTFRVGIETFWHHAEEMATPIDGSRMCAPACNPKRSMACHIA
jgi:hypothetical protein